jgi:dihydroorotate dehydrogenase
MLKPYNLFKTLAFQLDPELIHDSSIKMMSLFPQLSKLVPTVNYDESYAVKVGNSTWDFPVGLAAGLDKNACCYNFFSALGFGAIEVGTVTPKPQPGNDRPRLFRLKEEKSLRNRMGFNNDGGEIVLERVEKLTNRKKVLGVNLGKNKTTPQNKAVEDYISLYKTFAGKCEYLVINISSPNTPGLRDLGKKDELTELLSTLSEVREEQPMDLFVKLSPDMALEDIDELIKLCVEYKLTGVIATNTTIREDLGNGGISGELLSEKARTIRNYVLKLVEGIPDFEVIGVGGISDASELFEFWKNGGKVIQIYTSFIYQGPQILIDFKNEIDLLMHKNGVNSVNDLLLNHKEISI